MNHDDRIVIEDSLNIPGITLKQISSRLGRDGKTVREEIKKHRYISVPANRRNKCGKRPHPRSCNDTNLSTMFIFTKLHQQRESHACQ